MTDPRGRWLSPTETNAVASPLIEDRIADEIRLLAVENLRSRINVRFPQDKQSRALSFSIRGLPR
jgi:hypothetical protein